MKQFVAADMAKVRKPGATRVYQVKNLDLFKRALNRTAKGFDEVLAKE